MLYFTRAEVARHSTKDDCWVIARNRVYDVTAYVSRHPGGSYVIASKAGSDVTQHYDHHLPAAKNIWKQHLIGYLFSRTSCAIL